MREIKFRAWNGKSMDYIGDLQKIASMGDWRIIDRYKNVQQYTGLKDKYGKEIYEGDVVRICVEDDWDHLADKLSEYHDYEPKLLEVKFDPDFGGYGFDGEELFGMEYTYPLVNDLFVVEVIGNIYENPELIKEVCNT